MPLPIPNANETEDEFIKRFMEDEKTKEEYPDYKQRYAVCQSQWKKESKMSAEKDDVIVLSQATGNISNPSGWIMTFPRGQHYITKYGVELKFDDDFFGNVANAFDSPTLSKPFIDKDHLFGESFGDITEYKINDKGMLFKVELNDEGKKAIKGKQYSYISPAFGKAVDTNKKEYPVKLKAISLVNFPALEGSLPKLQDQIQLSNGITIEIASKKEIKERKMEDIILLASEFGLTKDASVESILSKVKVLKTENVELKTENEKTKTELKSAQDKAIELSQKLKEMETVELKKEADGFIKDCVEKGKVHPAVADMVLSQYMQNPKAIKEMYEKIPEKFTELKSVGAKAEETGLDAQIEALMLKANLNPKDPEDVKIFKANYKPVGGK